MQESWVRIKRHLAESEVGPCVCSQLTGPHKTSVVQDTSSVQERTLCVIHHPVGCAALDLSLGGPLAPFQLLTFLIREIVQLLMLSTKAILCSPWERDPPVFPSVLTNLVTGS